MSLSADNIPFARIWDLPTRLFHWTLAALIVLQYATGEFHLLNMSWHEWLGYATLVLVVFRLSWGLLGSHTSRFSTFVRGPRAVWRYLRAQLSGNPQISIGHNPLGGWSVLALLASIGIQCVSGLFSSDEIDTDGPLVGIVSQRTVKLMTRIHGWNQNLLLALIALHVIAVLMYLLLQRQNLVTPMITGRKQLMIAEPLRFASAWIALGLLALCTALVVALAWWFSA